ncbi:unnamed protein product, partial [Porites evermanni]
DDKSELLKEKRALETSLRKSAVGKAIFNSDPQQSIKNKNKSSQKQAVPKKPTAKDEEKAKKEAAKKAKEAEKAEAEKRRNAEIAARIAQATKRISSQHKKIQQDEPHHHSLYTEIHDDVHPLSLPAFRKQSLSTAHPASTSSQERSVNYKRQKTPQETTRQSYHTEIQEGDNVHPLSLPAFRKQSLCNGDPTSTSSQKQAAKRKHK